MIKTQCKPRGARRKLFLRYLEINYYCVDRKALCTLPGITQRSAEVRVMFLVSIFVLKKREL